MPGEQSARPKTTARRGKLIALLVMCAAALLLFRMYALAVEDGMTRHRISEMRLIAPDFEAARPEDARKIPDFTLNDRFGNPVSLSRFDSMDLLIVNIWSSGCPVCREEVPELMEMDRRLEQLGRVALITIAVEEKWDDVTDSFPAGTDLRILFDPNDEVGKGVFGTSKYPETFVLDKQRRLRARFDGRRPWHSEPMFRYLATFL